MTNFNVGVIKKERTQEIFDVFDFVEGTNNLYYGRVRNGKTYSATADILDLLKRGEIVYANWKIKVEDYDERSSFWVALVKFFARRKYFYNFKASNFHYFSPDDIDVAFLGRLVGVHIFIDEGQWLFNSHIREKQDDPVAIEKRKLILHGGHYCRSLNVITQRPTNVFLDIRSQINVWYKCEKRFSIGRFVLFQRWRIEDMKDGVPDEDSPVGRPKTYIGDPKIYEAYNTHGMRGGDAIETPPDFDVYELSGFQRFLLVLKHLIPTLPRLNRGSVTKPLEKPLKRVSLYQKFKIILSKVKNTLNRGVQSIGIKRDSTDPISIPSRKESLTQSFPVSRFKFNREVRDRDL